MVPESQRRFSLDKIGLNPELSNRIFSVDGEQALGSWDGLAINDLMKELDRIEEYADVSYASLPHSKHLPEDLKDQVAKDFPIWACDSTGMCLVGPHADTTLHVEKIRESYDEKYGGVAKFKEKIQKEIEERDARLWKKDND